ncbi:MAG: HAD-IIB family hydrolase, partial [Planctomycetes bacterium]|nr:HAD-IIB family hydrolase [Planctomycetota bacterium]
MTIARDENGAGGEREFGAILLDLDGTLVHDGGHVHPRNVEALRAASENGVVVMVATGRSLIATRGVIEDLGLASPAVVFNGAAIYCPKDDRMLEERILSKRLLAQAHALLERTDD